GRWRSPGHVPRRSPPRRDRRARTARSARTPRRPGREKSCGLLRSRLWHALPYYRGRGNLSGMNAQVRQQGRPPVADVESLRAAALPLIERHGYEQVSMSALAGELGVSVRTLHRYFPAKADIV